MELQELQGMTREEAIAYFKQNPERANLKHIIHVLSSLKTLSSPMRDTTTFKVGDVYISSGLGHPAVIFKIKGDLAFSVLMTSQQTYRGVLLKSNSRFYPGYLTATVAVIPVKSLQIVGVYDCNKDLIELRKRLKAYYTSLLNL